MKKNYLSITLILLCLMSYSQGAEFLMDFEGADPLGVDVPLGVTIVDAGGTDIQVKDLGTLTQVANSVAIGGTASNTLSMDRQSHIVLDETALGNGSFSIVAKYEGSGNGDNSMGVGNVQDTGFISVAVLDSEPNPGEWAIRRLQHKFTNGQMNGLKIPNTANAVGSRLPVRDDLLEGMKHVVLTYNDSDGLFRLYIEGDLDGIGGDNGGRLTGNTDVKVYLSYRGGSIDTSTGVVPASFNGDGDTKDIKSEWDDIAVYKRAITAQEVSDLYNGSNPLSLSKVTIQNIKAFPNPVINQLTIENNNADTAEIYNILGSKVVEKTKLSQQSIDISSLTRGLYMVKAFDKENTFIGTVKILKN